MSQSGSFLQGLLDLLARLFKPPESPASPVVTPPEATTITPLAPRVLMIVYNPVVDVARGRKLIETLGLRR